MKIIIGRRATVAVKKTVGSNIPISDITNGSEGVVTTTSSHGLSNGDIVIVSVTSGMVELDGQIARIKAASGSSLTLEGIDTTDFSDATDGVAHLNKVTAWESFDNVKSVDIPEAEPDRPETTTVHGSRKSFTFGLDGQLQGSMDVVTNPNQAAVALVRAATKAQARMALKVVTGGSDTILANCEWAGGRGFNLQTGQVSQSKISFNVVGEVAFYAAA
jgi:hypothetical protein